MADSKHRVAEIHLDKATRERLLKELDIQGTIDWIPDTIYVARPQSFATNVQPVKSAAHIPQIWTLIPQ
jgi:hypothetical protein